MGFSEKTVITASAIVNTVRAERNTGGYSSAVQLGDAEHARIYNAICGQVNPTLFTDTTRSIPLGIHDGEVVHKGKTLSLDVNDRLQLHVQPDVIISQGNQKTCIEIKPRYHELGLLQLMYGCMAVDAHSGGLDQGILYLYSREDHVIRLRDGGRSEWEGGLLIAELASEIISRKESSPLKVNDIAVTNYKERTVLNRMEMLQIWSDVKNGLEEQVIY